MQQIRAMSGKGESMRSAHTSVVGSNGDLLDLTVIIPMRNEELNVQPLYAELRAVLDEHFPHSEIIFIDDGSVDGTLDHLKRLAEDDPSITVVEFNRRFGQTAGLDAAFRLARGRIIVPMDGDLQNDPRDIPRLVAKLSEPPGWDIVSGWRKSRRDKFWSRRLPSVLANKLVRRLTRTPEIHDFGCTLKAYRCETLHDVRLYGEMHRFLPAICKWRGARVTEIVVNHRQRIAGETKYGLKRTIKVLLDLITVVFFGDYLTKPIYFFGKLTIALLGVTMLAGTVAVIQKFGYMTEHGQPVNLNDNIFVLFAAMTILMSIMFLMMGVISELLVRIYHESQDRTPYKIRRLIRGSAMSPSNGRAGAAELEQPVVVRSVEELCASERSHK